MHTAYACRTIWDIPRRVLHRCANKRHCRRSGDRKLLKWWQPLFLHAPGSYQKVHGLQWLFPSVPRKKRIWHLLDHSSRQQEAAFEYRWRYYTAHSGSTVISDKSDMLKRSVSCASVLRRCEAISKRFTYYLRCVCICKSCQDSVWRLPRAFHVQRIAHQNDDQDGPEYVSDLSQNASVYYRNKKNGSIRPALTHAEEGRSYAPKILYSKQFWYATFRSLHRKLISTQRLPRFRLHDLGRHRAIVHGP